MDNKEMMNKADDMMKVNGPREMSLDEMDKVSGGANFWIDDRNNHRKPGEHKNHRNQINDG